MVNQPFLEDFGATLPVNVAAASRQEASNGVAAQVVDPSFLSELTHESVDPRKSGRAKLPAIEPGFGFGAIDVVVTGYETVRRVDFGRQMPRYESAM